MTACYATAAETANPSHISGAPFNGSLWGGSAGSAGFYFPGLVRNFSGRYFSGGAGHECGPGGTRGRRTLVSLWDLPLASPPGRHPNSHVVRAARVRFSGFYPSRAGRGPLGLQDVIDLSGGYIHVSASEP